MKLGQFDKHALKILEKKALQRKISEFFPLLLKLHFEWSIYPRDKFRAFLPPKSGDFFFIFKKG